MRKARSSRETKASADIMVEPLPESFASTSRIVVSSKISKIIGNLSGNTCIAVINLQLLMIVSTDAMLVRKPSAEVGVPYMEAQRLKIPVDLSSPSSLSAKSIQQASDCSTDANSE